jgi:tight adherence protein C
LRGRGLQEFSRQMGQLGLNQSLLKIAGLRKRLDLILLRSGYPYGWKAENLLFYKEASVILAALVLWGMDVQDPILWGILLVGAFWMLDMILQARGRARKVEMQKELPGLVDLMALSIESGLDLMVAIERIFEKMKAGSLRDELQALLQESRLGAHRKDILQRWAYRTDLSDVQSLSSLIIQSEEMGTPLANVLRSYTEDMRSRRILRAEEQAGKIPVKILFPMMVFFFPIVFVIILGPVAMEYMK